MTLYSADGKQLNEQKITDKQTMVDVSGLVSGIYFLKVADERTVQVGKFIKQ